MYLGCLFGLAIGDALGAPVEFLRLPQIKALYGEKGIADFDSWSGFKLGFYTDDTQMSLATARGCIKAYQSQKAGKLFDPVADKRRPAQSPV